MAKTNFHPVILAGGRGTRFWPLSRQRRAKQLLALDGKQTMIQQTVARLLPLASPARFWVITNEHLRREVTRQLPRLSAKQILAEPAARNTAPAIGLAAFILMNIDPDAVIGLFPSDHVIGDEKRYRDVLKHGISIAAAGENIVVLGIRPTRAETGYGYIEAGSSFGGDALACAPFHGKARCGARRRIRPGGKLFLEQRHVSVERADACQCAASNTCPRLPRLLQQIASTFGTRKFGATFARLYPKCENISIDYAVLEPRSGKGEQNSNIICLPADFGWNDLGSWTALHEHHVAKSQPKDDNLIAGEAWFTLNAQGNYIHAPGKFVAAIGVNNLVIVETEDALLITTREQAQDVGKVVKYLDEKKLRNLV